MPEKQNKSKIKSILERGGLIRETGSDSSYDQDFNNPALRNESDIKPIFEVPDSAVKVTPAARQPIPGMPNPVFPSDKNTDTDYEPTRESDIPELERIIAEEVKEPEYYSYEEDIEAIEALEPVPVPTFSPPPAPVPAPVPASVPAPAPLPTPPPPEPVQQRSTPVFGNLFKSGNNTPEEPSAPPPVPLREHQPENYTDRFLNTEELYDALSLRSKKTDSIYLIEEYLQTLPDSLPDAQRRDIVNKLISASGFDYDLLMGDGVLRVKMLKEYAERFARHTDDYIAARQAELDELDQQILRTRRLIENRKDLHKKQFFSIEAEAQRLKEILTFISG